ncbi:Kelch repeat-containing protein [Saccharicrinis aurantiacus]|uniref:Kelch repeat-containing protein n=1 Tax=Saccharicrinis aurantiacus TaxID=1849719 RepID=UPI0009F9506E|nr:family 16 glycoside hydrolase [Saccharicrinis aurantiacus]
MKKLYSISFFILMIIQLSAQEHLDNYRWTSVETKGEVIGRHENSFIEFEGKFYLIGGRGIKPVNVFDPENNTWTSLGKTPFEIHHFQAVVYKDAIYLMGAMTKGYPKEIPVENIWIYYPNTDKWEKGDAIPKEMQRGGAGASLYKDKIYMTCGIEFGHTSGTHNRFDSYDLKTREWQSLTKAPHVRDHFSSIVVKDKLYCIGGRNSSVHYPNNFNAFFWATERAVDVYDFNKQEWYTIKSPLPYGTAAGALVNIGNSILYMGGEGSQKQAYTNTQCLNIETEQWTQLAPLCIGRHGTGAILYNNDIYIAAGSHVQGGANMNTVEKFSLNHSWKSLFNGHNLDGWSVKCIDADKSKNFWMVKDGILESNSLGTEDHHYIWLQNDEIFGDFELRLKFQASKLNKGNSGVQIRSRYSEKDIVENDVKGWLDGPQVDIDPNNPWRNGFIYNETRSAKRWIYPDLPDWKISKEEYAPKRVIHYFEGDETGWNDMTIICKGTRIKTIVNNIVVADYDGAATLKDKGHKKLKVGLEGYIALQIHKNSQNNIRFKNIEIREL